MHAQIMQKILPKLHGNRRQLEDLLLHLAHYCETGEALPGNAQKPAHLNKQPVDRSAATPTF